MQPIFFYRRAEALRYTVGSPARPDTARHWLRALRIQYIIRTIQYGKFIFRHVRNLLLVHSQLAVGWSGRWWSGARAVIEFLKASWVLPICEPIAYSESGLVA